MIRELGQPSGFTSTCFSRRTALRATGATLLAASTAGCVLGGESKRGVTDVVVRNGMNTSAEVTVTFVDCSISDGEKKTVTVAGGSEKQLDNVVVRNSGTCTLEVAAKGGPTESYDWEVGESTLHVALRADGMSFDARSS